MEDIIYHLCKSGSARIAGSPVVDIISFTMREIETIVTSNGDGIGNDYERYWCLNMSIHNLINMKGSDTKCRVKSTRGKR